MAAGGGRGSGCQPDKLPVRIGKLHRVISRPAGAIAAAAQDRPLPLARRVSGSSAAERAHGARQAIGSKSASSREICGLTRSCSTRFPIFPERRSSPSTTTISILPIALRGCGRLPPRQTRERSFACVAGACEIRDGEIVHLPGLAGHAIVQAELHDLPRRRLGHPLSPAIAPSHDRPAGVVHGTCAA